MRLSKSELLPLIQDASIKHGISEKLIYGVLMAESGGDPYAIRYESHYKYITEVEVYAKLNHITAETELMLQMSSIGLMQTMGALCRELGFKQSLLMLTRPQISINLGTKHLKRLSQKYNSTDDVISAYNAGSPRKIDGKLVNQAYVSKVREFMGDLCS